MPLSVKALCRCEINVVSKVSISKPQIFDIGYDDFGEGISILNYKENMVTNRISYKIEDISKCENYLKNYFIDYYAEEDIATESSKALCSGGVEKTYGHTLENFIYEIIQENEREEAGISNVSITPRSNVNSKEVVVPDYILGKPVTVLDTYSFYAKDLTAITLPNTLKRIEGADDSGALCGNKLTSIDLPESLEYIGVYAFNSNELTDVIIPDNVTKIDGGAFANNNISHLVLGKKVEEIETEAFKSNNLTTVIIPASVKKLSPPWAAQAFYASAFGGNLMRSVIIEGKSSSDDFDYYKDQYGTPFSWASDINCTPNNDSNVENGCITWLD